MSDSAHIRSGNSTIYDDPKTGKLLGDFDTEATYDMLLNGTDQELTIWMDQGEYEIVKVEDHLGGDVTDNFKKIYWLSQTPYFVVDPILQKVYFLSNWLASIYAQDRQPIRLYSADYDGTNINYIADLPGFGNGLSDDIGGMFFDGLEKVIYFADEKAIYRINADGTGITTLVSGQTQIRDICVEIVNDWLYWTNDGDDAIMRASAVDGSGETQIVTYTADQDVKVTAGDDGFIY